MKTRKAIYIVSGSLLILLNVLVDIVNPDKSPVAENDQAYSIGYFIGSHFLIVFGLLFLFLAFRVNKKIKNRPADELENDINKIGRN